MERYLLFDSDCGTCSRIAEAIAPETRGWLAIRSLTEPAIQNLLSKAKPNWKWQPTLLEIKVKQIRVFTGYSLLIRIFFGVGPLRSVRIVQKLKEYRVLGAILIS